MFHVLHVVNQIGYHDHSVNLVLLHKLREHWSLPSSNPHALRSGHVVGSGERICVDKYNTDFTVELLSLLV